MFVTHTRTHTYQLNLIFRKTNSLHVLYLYYCSLFFQVTCTEEMSYLYRHGLIRMIPRERKGAVMIDASGMDRHVLGEKERQIRRKRGGNTAGPRSLILFLCFTIFHTPAPFSIQSSHRSGI